MAKGRRGGLGGTAPHPPALLFVLVLAPFVLAGCEATNVQQAPAPALDQPAPPSPTPAVTAGTRPSPPAVQMEVLAGASSAPSGPGAYRYRVEVPRLDGSAVHLGAVDVAIRGTLQRQVDEFVAQARATAAARAPSDLECASRAVRLTARLAVLRVDCTEQLAGAPRPDLVTHTFNCDLVGGRILALEDLFSGGSTYLDVLSGAARAQLRARLPPGDDRTLDDGTAPVASNFKVFLLDRPALVIVLPGRYRPADTSGPPEVPVAYADLQRYLARGVADLIA